jgi:hypothetical protein
MYQRNVWTRKSNCLLAAVFRGSHPLALAWKWTLWIDEVWRGEMQVQG